MCYCPGRVRLLLKAGQKCFQSWKRKGERRRRSVRGCVIDVHFLSVLCMKIVRKGEADIPGLTDIVKPRPLGPKRASKIRKMFNLSKKDDVRQYVIRKQKPNRPLRKVRIWIYLKVMQIFFLIMMAYVRG